MKFLALLLSIYIGVLNLVPCEDNGAFDNERKTEISQDLNHAHQHQEADLCSPFCQCNCCQIQVTQGSVIEYHISNPVISTDIFHYFYGLEKDFNASILQPPQV